MSSTLCYEIVRPARRKVNALPTDLKLALRKVFPEPINHTFEDDSETTWLLLGLRAANVEGAATLLDLVQTLREGETLHVWEVR